MGPAIVTGDGPWFVSVGENGTWLDSHLEGSANYVVVEREGELRIANHYWSGLMTSIAE